MRKEVLFMGDPFMRFLVCDVCGADVTCDLDEVSESLPSWGVLRSEALKEGWFISEDHKKDVCGKCILAEQMPKAEAS